MVLEQQEGHEQQANRRQEECDIPGSERVIDQCDRRNCINDRQQRIDDQPLMVEEHLDRIASRVPVGRS